ncbi:MAG: NAD(P)H-dependent oxidoreductase [Pseudomonadota bacterium]
MDNVLTSYLLVVQFPLWWFGMPAVLKGWTCVRV